MQQKKLVIFTIILFIVSSAYLLAIGSKFSDFNFGENWWTVYFQNPKNNSLDFTIENHSTTANFHWTILSDKEKIKEGDMKITSGQSATVESPLSGLSADTNKKITIEVSASDSDKKNIYKNF
jgi:hypothetical protein